MKTTLISILLFIQVSAYSQLQAKLNVWKITPTSFCPGDTFRVSYKITPPSAVVQTISLIGIVMGNPIDTLWKGNFQYLQAQPYHKDPTFFGDSAHYIWIKMPITKTPGSYSIVTQSAMSSINEFTVMSCNLVGIAEQQINLKEPIYFDLNGTQIEKRPNELIIEQVGLKRRKIVILER